MFNKILATIVSSNLASADCATDSTLDSFLTGGCSCTTGPFKVSFPTYVLNLYTSAYNWKKTSVGSITGSCLGTAPTTVYPSTLYVTVSDSPSETYMYFYYSKSGYLKWSYDGNSMSTAITALPAEVTKDVAKANCVWFDGFTYTATSSKYLAAGLAADLKTGCMYYGASPPCSPVSNSMDDSLNQKCTTTSSSSTAFNVCALSLIAALTAAFAL